jgi:Ca2+-binding EF-hand superfamily protein
VDRDRSGAIDAVELQEALSNGTGTPFNPETVRLMIAMLDKKNSGSITFGEFGALWKYIDDWQTTFHRFDKDKSGGIDCDELKQCLSAFGYRLSDRFYQM